MRKRAVMAYSFFSVVAAYTFAADSPVHVWSLDTALFPPSAIGPFATFDYAPFNQTFFETYWLAFRDSAEGGSTQIIAGAKKNRRSFGRSFCP